MRKKVSIKEVVQIALDEMGMEETRETPVFYDWVIKADRRINAPRSYRRCMQVIEINNCFGQLPCETISVEDVVLGEIGCDQCSTLFPSTAAVLTERFNTGNGLVVIDNGSTIGCNASNIRWTVEDNKLILPSRYNGQKVTAIIRTYFLDENGFPMINEEHVDACSAFLQYMFAKRSLFKKKGRMSGDSVVMLDQEWHRLCAHARGKTGDWDGSKQEVIDDFNNPISGHGIISPFRSIYNNGF